MPPPHERPPVREDQGAQESNQAEARKTNLTGPSQHSDTYPGVRAFRFPDVNGLSVLDAALVYAAAGIAVFPCREKAAGDKGSKSPYTTNGFKDATTDPEQIRQWWAQWPGALVGAPVPDGLVCIDADPRHGARMDDLPGEVPATACVWSGGPDGGRHLYFTRPDGDLKQSALTASIARLTGRPATADAIGWDLRDAGKAYLILPPSLHPDTGKPYRWDLRTPLAMPTAITQLLRPPAPPQRDRGVEYWGNGDNTTRDGLHPYVARVLTDECDAVATHAEGGRNNRLNVAAVKIGHYVPHLIPYQMAADALVAAAAMSQTPGAAATIRSGLQAGMNDARGVPDRPSLEVQVEPVTAPLELVADLYSNPARDTDVTGTSTVPVTAPVAPEAGDEFWGRHPVLVEIRRYARANLTSDWAVLGVLITRALASMPSRTRLPGPPAPASLNAFIGLVGGSGIGKTAANRVAQQFMSFANEPETFPPGSGEGLTELFLRKDGPVGRQTLVRNDRDGAIVLIDEVGQLEALGGRQGSTLGPWLRSAWSGEQIGQTNADPTKNRLVQRDTYRLALIVGIQPEKARTILDDGGAGTPQRFLWAPASDPTMTAPTPEEEEWAQRRPTDRWAAGGGRGVPSLVPVCQEARQAVIAARLAAVRGESDALDGHALLCRLKVATGLSLICDRAPAVTEEWWQAAGDVMAVSDAARAVCVKALRRADRDEGERRGRIDGVRRDVADQVAAAAQSERLRTSILRWLADGPLIMGDLLRKSNSRDRKAPMDGGASPLVEALGQLIGAGQVTEESEYRNGGQALVYQAVS